MEPEARATSPSIPVAPAPAPAVKSSSDSPAENAAPQVSDRKRRRLGLHVSIEAGADGKGPVHQVFSDGTYIPALENHFERTSAAATAFVARALARPTAASASIEANATDSTEVSARWAGKAVTSIEGSLYELGRAIAVIEALRAAQPLLELKRSALRAPRREEGREGGNAAEKEGEGMIAAKKRLVQRSADFLNERVKAMTLWIDGDNTFCDAFLTMRKLCNGVRRLPNGTPLIDVGDGDFVPVLRPPDLPAEPGLTERQSEEGRPAKWAVHVRFPAATYLKFSTKGIGEGGKACAAPVALESERAADDHSLMAVVRRIRLSRVSAFRRKTFENVAREAADLPHLTELTTNTVGLESGPREILRLEKTQRSGTAPSLDASADASLPPVDNAVELQNASLLQIIASHACLTQAVSAGPQPTKIVDRVLAATGTRSVLQATERVLDGAVAMLRVRLEWTRSSSRIEESRVRVYSTVADGNGPERALATIEAISNVNNRGIEGHNGHVRITPAFGVIIAAPDDPGARGRAVAPHSHSSSSGGGSSPLGLDDVPRSYICPVGGEMLSVLTLLLCIRLLDALETTARAGVEEMLDVDRQCFTVIVSAPTNGHTLRAKVWPRGPSVGQEVPGATAWFNGQKVHSFPTVGPGRITAWKELLNGLIAGSVDVGVKKKKKKEEEEEGTEEKKEEKEDGEEGDGEEEVEVEGEEDEEAEEEEEMAAAVESKEEAGPAAMDVVNGGDEQFPFEEGGQESQFRFDL